MWQGNKHLLKLEKKLPKDLEDTLNQEEIMLWFQRSREVWIALGDRNTKYYNAATAIKKHRNTNKDLINDQGRWISDTKLIAKMIQDFLRNLFCKDLFSNHLTPTPNGFPGLSEEHRQLLQRPFSKDEVKRAPFDMAPLKSLDNDGFHAGFFQKAWNTVGDSLYDYALQFFNSGILPEGSNETDSSHSKGEQSGKTYTIPPSKYV